MVKRKKLSDLYVIGKDVTVSDKQDSVDVWIQKLNEIDHDACLRKAGAARAVHLSYRKDPESDEYKAISGEVMDFASRDTLIEMIIREEMTTKRLRVEAEVSAEEEWSKDEYLQGLFDAWNEGLKDEYARNNDDPEAKRVFEEMKRWTVQVDKVLEGERLALVRDYDDSSEDRILELSVDYFIKRTATTVFMEEYEIQQLFYAVRKPERHVEKYFSNRDEVVSIAPEVKEQLLAAYREISIDPMEGKDSGETPTSSPSSEQSEPEETDTSSGLKVVSI